MAEADSEKRSQDSGYEENENIEDAGSRSLKSYTSLDNSSLLSMELSDVSIYLKSLVKRSLISQLLSTLVNLRKDPEIGARWRSKSHQFNDKSLTLVW